MLRAVIICLSLGLTGALVLSVWLLVVRIWLGSLLPPQSSWLLMRS